MDRPLTSLRLAPAGVPVATCLPTLTGALPVVFPDEADTRCLSSLPVRAVIRAGSPAAASVTVAAGDMETAP